MADISPAIIVVLIVTVAILVIIIFFIVLFIWRRSELQALLYAKTGVRIGDKKAPLDKEERGSKPFDAFISYSQPDHSFVQDSLVPDLEKNGYRVCVHYRDFPVGGDISDVIKRAIHLSSRTLMIVSRHFLKSNWCRYEFQTAHHHILKEGSHRLVLVFLEDIPGADMDPDFSAHMKINTYLKVTDVWFWEKLHFALPDISKRKGEEEEEDVEENDDNMVMRGMRILMRKEECNDDGGGGGEGKRRRNVGCEGESKTNDEEEEEGSEKGKGKINWKKEEERILSERMKREIMMNDMNGHEYGGGIKDGEIELEWTNKAMDVMYVNKGFERGESEEKEERQGKEGEG